MPKVAAFPKAWLDNMCVTGDMSLETWIKMSTSLDVDGLEFYSEFLDLQDHGRWPEMRKRVEDLGMSIPMLCCSPDFTHPDAAFRADQVDKEKFWIDMAHALGSGFCRVLSGQRRPEITQEDGIRYAAECIEACLGHAADVDMTLVIENHYKDNVWLYPEFAQRADVFCDLIARIDNPHFGVNYDPSNTILAGEDPIDLLERVKHRVLTMHASDRYIADGTIEDLRREENVEGYAQRLRHGEIGKGMNDYDRIFSILKDVGFDGWVSIEDGMDGIEQMQRSVVFLRQKIHDHWGQ